jgi:hypothetical protein
MTYATPISARRAQARAAASRARFSLLVTSALCLSAGMGFAVDGKFSARVIQQFQKAEARYLEKPANLEAAWQFGRACFDLADFSTNNTERAAIAERGMAACRTVVERDPKSVPGHYYLGMNMGQSARTKIIGALKLVKEMEREFSAAADGDPKFDYAGPARNLGLLYRDAPVIGSIGSKPKAREYLTRAATLVPDYPENRLALAEGYLKWGDRPAAREQVEALHKCIDAAKKQFAGPEWDSSWVDWNDRLADLDKKLSLPPRLNAPK